MTFSGHVDTEAIQVDETFVEIHAEDDNSNDNDNDNDNNFEYQPFSLNRPGTDTEATTNMDLLMDNDWASQGFDYLARRPLRSEQPRFTNRELNRGSCFF